MRLKLIVPLVVVAAAAGGYTLWDQAKDRAAREREGRFANPYRRLSRKTLHRCGSDL